MTKHDKNNARYNDVILTLTIIVRAGEIAVSAMAAVRVAHESAGQKDHEEDDSHEQSDEGTGAAGKEQ